MRTLQQFHYQKTFFRKSPRDRYKNCNFHKKKSFSNTIRSLHWCYSLYFIKADWQFIGLLLGISWSLNFLTKCITLCFLITLHTTSEHHPYIYQMLIFLHLFTFCIWLQQLVTPRHTHYWCINIFSTNQATCFWGLISLYYPLWILASLYKHSSWKADFECALFLFIIYNLNEKQKVMHKAHKAKELVICLLESMLYKWPDYLNNI